MRELLVPSKLSIRFPHRLEPPVPREVEILDADSLLIHTILLYFIAEPWFIPNGLNGILRDYPIAGNDCKLHRFAQDCALFVLVLLA